MRHTIEQLERMLASKTVQSSPRLKALYGERLAHLKQVRFERQERGRASWRGGTSTSTRPTPSGGRGTDDGLRHHHSRT